MTCLLVATLLALTCQAGAAGAAVPAAPPPQVASASAIVVDLDSGKILWAKDDQSARPPASLTKILTAYVVLHSVSNLNDTAVITPDARSAPGSRTYAEAGWSFTIRDLLWGLMLQSGNDAAIALAHKVSPDGTVPGFMNLVNQTAQRLGATQTNFVNPHGYDEPGHMTTARDLATITLAAMKDPIFAEMVASKSHDIAWGDGSKHTFFNHNKLLWRYPGTIGVKTGFTEGAGHGLVSAVHRDNGTLVTVLMDSPDHYAESIALYNWAFTNLDALRAAPLGVLRPGNVDRPASKSSAIKKTSNAPNKKTSSTSGLQVVQLRPEVLAAEKKSEHPTKAPLLVPALAFGLATLVGSLFRKRRRKQKAQSRLMQQFQQEFDALGGRLEAPEPVDA
ncbi:MAG: D-alanyl-D-alanine carboxypeptidase [Actinobacteria bacterium]|nr:D-alanyl-D-alanine carboxypeptidase [Actinomycetota bacterium]